MAYATTTQLSAETTARKLADSSLQKEIDDLKARIAALEAPKVTTPSTNLPTALPAPLGR